jgi:hypothetical protein
MPTKPQRGAVPDLKPGKRAEWDPLAEAFRDHGLDPSEPDARERLLQSMVLRNYPKRAKRGRPKGSKKLNRKWRLQLFLDWLQLKQQVSWKLSKRRGAGLLKAKFSERYKTVTPEWLRQCLGDACRSEGLDGLGASGGLRICGPSANDGSYTLENRDGDVFVMIVPALDDSAPPRIHERIRIDSSRV